MRHKTFIVESHLHSFTTFSLLLSSVSFAIMYIDAPCLCSHSIMIIAHAYVHQFVLSLITTYFGFNCLPKLLIKK